MTLFLRLPNGRTREVAWRVVSVSHSSVEIEHERTQRRQRIEWVELERRSRMAPIGWPRATWLELLELARDMRAPGYLARRRQQTPYWIDPIESRDPDTRAALLGAIGRFEDHDDSVVGTFVGGPAHGQKCTEWMTSSPTVVVEGRTVRYDRTHLETKRGPLRLHVWLRE